MANEITINLSVSVIKGNLNYRYTPGQLQADLATARRGGHCQTIGTTAEAVSFGDVASASFCILRNLHATLPVEVGPQSGTTSGMESFLRIPAGRFVVLWLDSPMTMMAQGIGGSVDLQVDVFEA